jgi:hypothetical protein
MAVCELVGFTGEMFFPARSMDEPIILKKSIREESKSWQCKGYV